MANSIAIFRAAHLEAYTSVFRDTGVPVASSLARSKLPTWIEECPDAYLSLPLAMEWVGFAGKDFTQTELGAIAAQRATLSAMSLPLKTALLSAPTGLMRLRAFVRLAAREDNFLSTRIRREGHRLRLIIDIVGMQSHPFVAFGEWLNVKGAMSVVQSVAGPCWRPDEITFVSPHRIADQAQAEFPNTRIRRGQRHTSILFDLALLAGITFDASPKDAEPLGDDPEPWDLVSELRALVQPYLAEGYPDIGSTAEIVGLSKRTLQRRLKESGKTYSGIVEEARLGLAMQNLRQEGARIVDVAHASGYENPQHFARAFRRLTGLSPTAYRRIGNS